MTEREGFDGLDLDGKKPVVALWTANGIRKLAILRTPMPLKVDAARQSQAAEDGRKGPPRPSLRELYKVQNLLFPLRTEPNSTFQS